MEPTYIFGHKNPDTDSICSAITYAYLKNIQAKGHIPARLGDLNRETQYVLDRFNVEVPLLLPHVYLRAEDVMTTQIISAPTTCTIHDVGLLMLEHNIHAVPIIDEVGRVAGVVTERTLARNYLKELHVQGLQDTPTPLGKIAATLGGQVVVGDPATTVQGKVVTGAMSPEAMIGYIAPGDLVALGNRENAQEAALRRGISCLIITGNFSPSPAIQNLAEELGTAIIVSPHGTFTTTRLINLSVSTMQMLDSKVLMVTPETLVRDITSDLVESKAEIALVNDTQGRLVGVLS
ncbi:MAG: DRTGG domain-containing protein, partial [Anaerolineae bacterium]|nr:DRTGG domain-containing protein [Anaerolineae bacterium]